MTKEFDKYMGAYLKKIREISNMSQKEVNEHMGKKRTWISDVELGRGRIFFEDIVKLCELYNSDVDKLFEESRKHLGDKDD